MHANLPKLIIVVTWRGGWNYLGCAGYLTYCNFTYNPFGRYHSVHFTNEEIAAQGGELVRIAVSLGFDYGFPG